MAPAVSPSLNVLSLCSGVGMLDEGLHAGLGHLGIRSRVLAYVERESYAAATLLARMEEQSLEPAPVWCGDLERLDCSLFAGRVDCVVAGFPCQPWSVAGAKLGTDDARWIWPAIMAIVRAVGAPLVFLENVPGLVSGGGLDPVLGALAEGGFDAEWLPLAAAEVGASHKRERVFILAVEPERGRRILRQSSRRDGFADGSDEGLGDARLQYGQLQQRAHGNEHSRAGLAVEDAARISGGERPGRERVLESGSGLGHTSGVRSGKSHHKDGAEPWQRSRALVGGAGGELAVADGPRLPQGGGKP